MTIRHLRRVTYDSTNFFGTFRKLSTSMRLNITLDYVSASVDEEVNKNCVTRARCDLAIDVKPLFAIKYLRQVEHVPARLSKSLQLCPDLVVDVWYFELRRCSYNMHKAGLSPSRPAEAPLPICVVNPAQWSLLPSPSAITSILLIKPSTDPMATCMTLSD